VEVNPLFSFGSISREWDLSGFNGGAAAAFGNDRPVPLRV
jgi:hypothetical protein